MTDNSKKSRLTRRDVLKGAAGAATLAGLRPRALQALPGSGEERYDCAVLGAGIAGVTAARELHEAGFRVLVLEGSGRVGGRMFTMRDFVRHPRHRAEASRYPLEAGAEYVHVGDQKRYAEFFAELDRHGFTRRAYPKVERNRLAFPDWSKNPKKLILALLRNTNLIPTVTLLSGIAGYDRPQDMPAGAYVAAKKYKGKGIRLARYTVSSHTPGLLFDPAVDVFHPFGSGSIPTCNVAGNGPVDTISVAGMRADRLPDQLFYELSEYKMERGGEACGYDALPAAIADQLRDPARNPRGVAGELMLGQRVVDVRRDEAGLAITAESANGAVRTFLARSAVCTFSAGMLNPVTGRGGTIFGELLTEDKRQALESIRFGPITKFSLEFNKGHWGCKSKMTVMSHPTGCARTFFSAFPGRRKGPHVLTGLLMNQDHEIIRGLDDEAAVRHLLHVLQSVLAPRKPAWQPEDVLVLGDDGRPNFHRQDWQADEFAMGGNSYLAYRPEVDSAGVARVRGTLRDPRPSLPLFWAGEATATAYNPDYQPLSVHGAYISGFGAARDVAEYLRLGASADAFRSFYAAGERAAAMRLRAAPLPPLTLVLDERELAALERYAAEREEGDLEGAARELCMTGLYLQRHKPRSLAIKAPPRPADRPIEVSFTPDEQRRIGEYAARYTGDDSALAARALLKRGLEASR